MYSGLIHAPPASPSSKAWTISIGSAMAIIGLSMRFETRSSSSLPSRMALAQNFLAPNEHAPQDAQKCRISHPPDPAETRLLSQVRTQRTIHFLGVAGMIPTARVQRGPSETARCASTAIIPTTPPIFQHPTKVGGW